MPSQPKYNPFRFASAYRDQESAGKYQYYMGARYHDPAYGRFSHVDPLGGIAIFGYANNNPLIYGDPFGTDPLKWARRLLKAFVGDNPGYVDFNYSRGVLWGILGPTFGVQVGQEGFRGYGGGGLVLSGGWSVTASANTPSSGCQVGIQGGGLHGPVGGQVGSRCNGTEPFVEGGYVPLGFSVTVYYVTRPWCPWCR